MLRSRLEIVMSENPTQSKGKTVAITMKAFNELPDYSCSLPTGTTIGKQWKRRNCYHDASKGWSRGEFVPHSSPGTVGIEWREIVIVNDE